MVCASPCRASGISRVALSRADVANQPAHLEAFVALPDPDAGDEVVHWQLATGSLDAWAQEPKQEHEGDRLALTPEDLGLRITYLASALGTGQPYRDMALPFAVEQ